MKKYIKLLCLLLTLSAMSGCKSDYDKYYELMNEAANSPITVLTTPDGINFNISTEEYNSYIYGLPQKELDYQIYYPLSIESEVYAARFSAGLFYEGKLCGYDISIGERIVNDTLKNLFVDDVKKVVEHYKIALGEDCKMAILPEMWPEFDTYVLTKGNLAIEVTRSHYSGLIKIAFFNRPISINIKEEKTEESTYSPTVTVKNNKWNGGVKQVEDYLKQTLRDPDSYESIEWSEVKRKDDGFYVRHKYKAKNGFGGYVITNQLFHLDFSGNVVDVKDLF